MDFFDRSYYRFNKTLTCAVGQWPFQSSSVKSFIRSFVLIAYISLIIPQSICYYKLWGDNLDSMLERTLPALTTVIYALKGFNLFYNEQKIRKLLMVIKNDWEILSSEQEFEIIKLYAERSSKITRRYMIYVLMTTLAYLLPPMVPYVLDTIVPRNETRARRFIYQADYGLDDDEKYYVWILLHDYIVGYAKIATSFAADTLFMVFAQHACSIFAALGKKLENVVSDDIHDAKDSAKEGQVYEEICLCVKRHKNAIEFVSDVENAYALSYLIQLAVTVVIISLIGLEILLNLDKPHEAVRFLLFLVGHMYSLFFISLPSQRLMDHSTLIRNNAYSSKWYEMSIRCKRLLIMIMMRSTEPCKLTAGKIYVLNLESYSAVLRASMSYFTMLTSLR